MNILYLNKKEQLNLNYLIRNTCKVFGKQQIIGTVYCIIRYILLTSITSDEFMDSLLSTVLT